MNYPDSKATGELGEMDVARLFVSWKWTVGKDHIDTGYDLNVEPTTDEFRGHRFLVQVKSSKKSKRGKVVAKVKKSRLRQYAKNPLPVFLVRVTPDGMFYWLHVQRWAKTNMGRIADDGDADVPMPDVQTLNTKTAFVDYLREVFKPEAEKSSGLSELARERSNYLSQIDSRLLVKAGVKDDGTIYELHARDQPVSLNFSVTPSNPIDGTNKLIDAIRYGMPTTIDVDNLSFSGSKVLEEIGASGPLKGKLSISTNSARSGTVVFHPGATHSILATALSLPAKLYQGQGGISISNEGQEGVFSLSMRSDLNFRTNFTVGLRNDLLEQAPIQNFHELALLGDWAYEMLRQGSMRLELQFSTTKPALKSTISSVDSLRPVLRNLFWIGRLHKVAKALDSDWVLPKNFAFTVDDENDIFLAYWLLKGDRREVELGSVHVVEWKAIDLMDKDYALILQTALIFSVGDMLLGTIPIRADLEHFKYEPLETGKGRLVKGDGARAFMYFNEGGSSDVQMIRKKLEEQEVEEIRSEGL